MSLKQRIYLQFLVAVLPLALLIGYQAVSRNDLPQRVNVALKSYDLALEASNAFKEFLSGVADAIDTGKIASNAVAALARARESQERLGALSPDDAQVAARIARVLAAVASNPSVNSVMPLKVEVQALRTTLGESTERRRHALTLLIEEEEAAAQRKQELTVVAGLGALLLLAFTAYILRRLVLGITRPIAQTVAAANAIAAGRLDSEIVVHGNDEIAQLLGAMKAMQMHLADIVRSVRAGSQSVAAASTMLSSETLELSHRSEEQAASLEQAAASMEELSTTVRGNTGNAREANALAQSAAEAAALGSGAMRRVVGTMQDITASAARIKDIVGVIDGIAFQTNILALNAAVEAARAGEHGRGFAVVASEVRGLSQRCAVAATEIKALVATSAERVGNGAQLVDEAGNSMELLLADVKRVSGLMNDIASASVEQERGIAQVTTSVTQMDGAVQQNAVAVQRSAAASEKLKRDARELADTVSRFRLREDEAAGEPTLRLRDAGEPDADTRMLPRTARMIR